MTKLESFEYMMRKSKPENCEEGPCRSLEKIYGFLKETGKELREQGLSLEESGRVEISEFKGKVYSAFKVENDIKKIKKIESRFSVFEGLPEKDIEVKRKSLIGEQLETLTTAIFQKFLINDFIVVRASRFDDVKNGIDNIILDKETGDVVCAFDEVSSMREEELSAKRERVLKKNMEKQGSTLEYGLKLETEGSNKGKIVPCPKISNIPLFYLALSPEVIRKTIQKFSPDFSYLKASEEEKKTFNYFVKLIDFQIASMDLSGSSASLNPEIEKKFQRFKEFSFDKMKKVVDRLSSGHKI